MEFGENNNIDTGDDYDDPSKGGNRDKLKAFIKGGLDSLKGLDKEDDDKDINEDTL